MRRKIGISVVRSLGLVVALAVAAAGLAGPIGPTHTADATSITCGAGINGKGADDKMKYRSIRNRQVRYHFTTARAWSWTPKAWLYPREGGSGQGDWLVSWYVPSGDGRMRDVFQRGTNGTGRMTQEVRGILRQNWNPHRVAGTDRHVYTVSRQGVIRQIPIVNHQLGDARVLPVKLPTPKTLTVVQVERNGNPHHVLYSTHGRTGALRQVVLRPSRPGQATRHRLEASGYGNFTHLKAGTCWRSDFSRVPRVLLIGINRNTGNARVWHHTQVFQNRGDTMTGRTVLGRDGNWRWTGIG